MANETLEGADAGSWGRTCVWAGADSSEETPSDTKFFTSEEITAEVWVEVASLFAAVVSASVDDNKGVAVGAWVVTVTVFVVATVVGFAGADAVALTVVTEACVAPVEFIPGVGILTVFAAVVAGVQADCSSEGAAAVMAGVEIASSFEGPAATSRAGEVVTLTPSFGSKVVSVTIFASAVVVPLAGDVAGAGVQTGAGDVAEGMSATVTLVTDTCAAAATVFTVAEVEIDSIETLVVVTFVLVWAVEVGTVFTGADVTDVTGTVVVSVSDLVAAEGLAWTIFTDVTVVTVSTAGEDVEAITGIDDVVETVWVADGVDMTVAGVEVMGSRAEGGGKHSTTEVLGIWTDFTVVVAAGVGLTVFENVATAAVIIVTGTVGTAVIVTADDDTGGGVVGVLVSGVANVAVLRGLGAVVFTFVGACCRFGSSEILEAVETAGVGLTSGRIGDVVLVSITGVVVVWVAVTGIVAGMESGPRAGAGAELRTWPEVDVEGLDTGGGDVTWSAGAVGAWTVVDIGVEA